MKYSMRMTLGAAAVAVIGGGLVLYKRADARDLPAFRFATVARVDLRSTVSATGALSALRTVQVGTQVSGQVAAIYVDFNDKVTKGELLARIDPTLQQQAVEDAQAGVERAQAQLALAKANHEQNAALHSQRFVTDAEFNATESAYAVAQAEMKSAEIALSRARQNLSYTSIYAPIDGVVVERNVDVGQTVAASLSAPQLFLIANSLSDMQILASVDESDIGRIKEGQAVSFTVQSYPNETFTGTVKQVRLQSTTTENVVNYTAVVSVANTSGKLLPGMTATVKLVTSEVNDALVVPNAALRYQPPAALLADAGIPSADTARGARAVPVGTTPAAAGRGASRGSAPRAAFATLWTLESTGKLVRHRVRTGLTDGQQTQLLGDALPEGTQVIAGAATTQAASASPATTNPLQPQGNNGQRRPPGAF